MHILITYSQPHQMLTLKTQFPLYGGIRFINSMHRDLVAAGDTIIVSAKSFVTKVAQLAFPC